MQLSHRRYGIPDFAQDAVRSSTARSASARVHERRIEAGWFSITAAAWAVLDILTTFVAAFVAVHFRRYIGDTPASAHLPLMATTPIDFFFCILGFAAVLVFFTYSYGLYGSIEGRSGLNEFRLTLQAAAVAGLIICGSLYLARGEAISRIILLTTIFLSAVLLSARRVTWRHIVYNRYREGVATRNILILGTGRVAHALRNHLESLRHFGFRFKGFIALNEDEVNAADPDIIGNLDNCLSLARGLFVDEIFISVPAEKNRVIPLVEEARTLDIDVRVVPDLYDGLAWNAPIEYVGQFPTIPLHRRHFPVGRFMVKRAIDVIASSLAILLLLPLHVLLALLVRIDSPGPIFYRALRIGRKGRSFTCFKYRTMVPNADHLKKDLEHRNERDGILFKVKDDPRVTRVGRYLRRYSLDEMPQFWNVIRGDMSLVGPRPPMAAEVEQYDLAHLRRLDVLPGLTGLWQVEAREDPSFDSYISLDTAYVENWSLWLDLKIIARTVGVVFSGTGS